MATLKRITYFLASYLIATGISTLSPASNEAEILSRILEGSTHLQFSTATFMPCFLKFLLYQNITILPGNFDLAKFAEPYMLYYKFHQSYHFVRAKGKFKSTCWNSVISVNTLEAWSTIKNLIVSDPVFDRHIFVASDACLLQQIMGSATVANKISRKIGILMEATKSGVITTSYFIEPSVFSGSGVIKTFGQLNFPEKFNNLNGRLLNVAYVNIAPYILRRKDTGTLDGSQYKLVHEIALRTNTTLNFYDNLTTPGIGAHLKNGSWTGIVGEIASGQADLTPTMGYSLERYPVFSYTSISYIETLVLSLSIPKKTRRWTALINPLTLVVWISTFLAYVTLTGVFMWKMLLQSELLGKHYKHGFLKMSLSTFVFFFKSFLEQSGRLPSLDSSRQLVAAWILFSYVIGTAYKSNLVTFLTFSGNQKIPTTYEELYESPEYSIILYSIGGMEIELIRTSPSHLMREIARRMTVTRNKLECLHAAATRDKTVCIGWRGFILYAIAEKSTKDRHLESLYVSREPGGVAFGCVGFRKGSIFQETFSRYVGYAVGGHLTDRWKERFTQRVKLEVVANATTNNFRQFHDDQHVKPLNISNLFIVFVVILVGCFLACIAFSLELTNFIRYK